MRWLARHPPVYMPWVKVAVQGLLVYIASQRGLAYAFQSPRDPRRPGTFFTDTGVEHANLAAWATLLLAGAALVFVGLISGRQVLVAAGHGSIAVVYLALGSAVLLVNPLSSVLFATGLVHMVFVAGIGSAMGARRGAARQQRAGD